MTTATTAVAAAAALLLRQRLLLSATASATPTPYPSPTGVDIDIESRNNRCALLPLARMLVTEPSVSIFGEPLTAIGPLIGLGGARVRIPFRAESCRAVGLGFLFFFAG